MKVTEIHGLNYFTLMLTYLTVGHQGHSEYIRFSNLYEGIGIQKSALPQPQIKAEQIGSCPSRQDVRVIVSVC